MHPVTNESNARRGALIMAYGSPESPDQIEEYYTHIRRGRPPTEEALADLVGRYEALGGTSTLRRRTADQVGAITLSLQQDQPGRWASALGQKHEAPFVEDGVAHLLDVGVSDIVGLVLAPHYSAASVGQYHDRARAACSAAGIGYAAIHSWWSLDAYRDFMARQLSACLAAMPTNTKVLVTAHSLPLRVLDGDPYVEGLTASATAIAGAAGLDAARWTLGWQSAGRTPEPWAGPDVLEQLRTLAEDGHTEGVLVVPQGFTSDHLEVAYDLDIEAARLAGSLGLAFARTAVVNDDRSVMAELAELIHDQVAESGLPGEALET